MRTLVAKLNPDLSNQDPCNPIPILTVVETIPEDGKKILAFEFDRFLSKQGKRFHVGSILLSEIKDLIVKFENEYGRASILDSSADEKQIQVLFYDQSLITLDIYNLKRIETWIRPNQSLPKMFRGFTGTFQYFDGKARKRLT